MITLRRLWPSPMGDAPGSLVTLPAEEVDQLLARGAAFRIFPPAVEHPGPGPIGDVIRRLVADDPERRGLVEALRAHAGARGDVIRAYRRARGLDARWTAGAGAALPLASTIRVVRDRPEPVSYAAPPTTVRRPGDDLRAGLLSKHIQRRTEELLAAFFDDLRLGVITATGFLAGGTEPCTIPPEIWSAGSVAVVPRQHAVVQLGAHKRCRDLFVDVSVAAPALPARPLPQAALERFVRGFARKIEAAGCLWTCAELEAGMARAFPEHVRVTEHRLLDEVHRQHPPAQAKRRRYEDTLPSPDLLAAATQAGAEAAARPGWRPDPGVGLSEPATAAGRP